MHMPTSFPGSLFSASIVVETMEAEKRDPGNEVVHMRGCDVLCLLTALNQKKECFYESACAIVEYASRKTHLNVPHGGNN